MTWPSGRPCSRADCQASAMETISGTPSWAASARSPSGCVAVPRLASRATIRRPSPSAPRTCRLTSARACSGESPALAAMARRSRTVGSSTRMALRRRAMRRSNSQSGWRKPRTNPSSQIQTGQGPNGCRPARFMAGKKAKKRSPIASFCPKNCAGVVPGQPVPRRRSRSGDATPTRDSSRLRTSPVSSMIGRRARSSVADANTAGPWFRCAASSSMRPCAESRRSCVARSGRRCIHGRLVATSHSPAPNSAATANGAIIAAPALPVAAGSHAASLRSRPRRSRGKARGLPGRWPTRTRRGNPG